MARNARYFSTTALAALFATVASAAMAQEPGVWSPEIAYTADVAGVIDGGPARAGRYLDNLYVGVDGDLSRLAGWRGARLHASVLANGGGEPNAVAGTLQGIDNIEVERQAVRLFELWIEQSFAGDRGSVLAGLYDVNSEFYATDASTLLISPPFGIGSELAATGPNGPSIFPSTALAARVRFGGSAGAYAQAAVVNASAGALGDPQGIDTDLDEGVLLIAETGWNGPLRFAVGGWRYDQRQEDIRDVSPGGDPALSLARGGYLLAEADIFGDAEGLRGRVFARAGVSDGDTTDFEGGWQTGVRIDHLWVSRPESAFSFGLHRGVLSPKARANARDLGINPAGGEEGLEVTYSDTIGRFTIQPDLQVIRSPGGDRDADAVVVATLRVSVALN